ncbi:hypothetical protein [Nostoc sp.]|uniref:hypothetical protein n=1 Tax=Nostoc sp. TaxID=1180 RepID=UPI002FF70D19
MAPVGLTQQISQTLISLCRASCFFPWGDAQGTSLLTRKGALASLRPLRFVIP